MVDSEVESGKTTSTPPAKTKGGEKEEFLKTGVKNIELVHEMGGDLIDNISRLAHTTRATLITMGITGKSAIRQAMFGSNTLRLIDKNLYPVMIIPPDAVYKGINHVAFASDFKRIEETTPAELITAVLEIFNPMLHIVNVNKAAITPPLKGKKKKGSELIETVKKATSDWGSWGQQAVWNIFL